MPRDMNRHREHTALVKELHLYAGGKENPDCGAWTNPTGFDRQIMRPYGLQPGSSDIIVCQQVLIRPEHVGRIIGVMHGWDAKTGNADLEQHQRWFSETLRRLGGVSGAVRSKEDCDRLLAIWR